MPTPVAVVIPNEVGHAVHLGHVKVEALQRGSRTTRQHDVYTEYSESRALAPLFVWRARNAPCATVSWSSECSRLCCKPPHANQIAPAQSDTLRARLDMPIVSGSSSSQPHRELWTTPQLTAALTAAQLPPVSWKLSLPLPRKAVLGRFETKSWGSPECRSVFYSALHFTVLRLMI